MGRAAVNAAKAVGYVGAGTVEFIADGSKGLRADGFYFMEMNTRLQVEHPVTEMITGLDLVELQLRVAAGEPLPFAQGDLRINGHAVEARVYAEDPENDFLPSTGKLWALRLPEATLPSPVGEGGPRSGSDEGEARATPGIRVDSGVAEGGAVTPYYDPMIAKVIAHGGTRDEALDRLSAALRQTIVAGPKSNVRFLRLLANHPDFRAGRLDTGLIEREKAALGAVAQPLDTEAAGAAAHRLFTRAKAALGERHGWAPNDPWSASDGFGLGVGAIELMADGQRLAVIPHAASTIQQVVDADEAVLVIRDNRQMRAALFRSIRCRSRRDGRCRRRSGQVSDARQARRADGEGGRRRLQGAEARGGGGDEDGACAGGSARRHRVGGHRRGRRAGRRRRAGRDAAGGMRPAIFL